MPIACESAHIAHPKIGSFQPTDGGEKKETPEKGREILKAAAMICQRRKKYGTATVLTPICCKFATLSR
jgi:hypothetical protein